MPSEVLLLHAAVKATILVGIALLVVSCLPRVSAATRHAVLLAAMMGALLVPLLSATLPARSIPPMPGGFASVSPELGRLGDKVTRWALDRSAAIPDPQLGARLRSVAETWRSGILTFWIAGTAVVLFRIAADLAAALKVLGRATLQRLLDADIPLLESAEIGSPVTVGIFRPAIIVPKGMSVETDALQSVITHELTHVARRDCLTQLVVRLTCAAYWFNPVVWYAAHRIALERERACDDQVLASGTDPIGYSKLLIDMARRHLRPTVRPDAALSMAQVAHLESRIIGILDKRTVRRGLTCRGYVAVAVIASGVVAPVAAFGRHERPDLPTLSDAYLDPQSERVPGAREPVQAASIDDQTTADGALIATLRDAAMQDPKAPYDLVPDRARWALSLSDGGRIIEPLMAELAHPDWRVRGYAAWALAVSRDPRAVEPLIPLLRDPVWRLRAMAAFALRQIGGPRAATEFVEALGDPAWQVRVEAVGYFGALGDSRFRGRIEPLRTDPHIAVRLAADEALTLMR